MMDKKITTANNVYSSLLINCLIEVKAYLESRQILKFGFKTDKLKQNIKIRLCVNPKR